MRRATLGHRTLVLLTLVVVTVLCVYFTKHFGHERRPDAQSLRHVTRKTGGVNTGLCKPHKRYFLLKTHKCASTSIQNVMYRFAFKHHLTVMLPAAGNFFTAVGWPRRPQPEHLMPHPRGGKFDVLANHIVYDRQFISDFLGDGTKRIAALREPWDHFKSYWNFFGLSSPLNEPLDMFLLGNTSREKHWISNGYPSQGSIPLRNVLSVQFGLESKDLHSEDTRRGFIDQVIKEFDLIIVFEHITESLVVLKNIMCWSYKDVVIFGLNKSGRDSNAPPLAPAAREKHRNWSSIDYELYKRANISLWHKAKQIPDFYDQVEKLTSLQKAIQDFISIRNSSLTLAIDNLGEPNITFVDKQFTDQMSLLDVNFNELFMNRQHPHLQTERFKHECCTV